MTYDEIYEGRKPNHCGICALSLTMGAGHVDKDGFVRTHETCWQDVNDR